MLLFCALRQIAEVFIDAQTGNSAVRHRLGNLQDTANAVTGCKQSGHIGLVIAVYLDVFAVHDGADTDGKIRTGGNALGKESTFYRVIAVLGADTAQHAQIIRIQLGNPIGDNRKIFGETVGGDGFTDSDGTVSHQEAVTLGALADTPAEKVLCVEILRQATAFTGCQKNGACTGNASGSGADTEAIGFTDGNHLVTDDLNAQAFHLCQTTAEQLVTADRLLQSEIIFNPMALAQCTGIPADDQRRKARTADIQRS